jgi:hypothetical protein
LPNTLVAEGAVAVVDQVGNQAWYQASADSAGPPPPESAVKNHTVPASSAAAGPARARAVATGRSGPAHGFTASCIARRIAANRSDQAGTGAAPMTRLTGHRAQR